MTSFRIPYVDFPSQFAESKAETLLAIERVFERGDFIMGGAVEQFETEFAELCGARHAIAVANGTDSLILAMKVLGVGPGDEVITAPNSWISSTAAIALVGATPVFADVESDQNISPARIEAAISPRTKAILPIHLTGRCCKMPEILAMGRRHGIPVIEDAAQSILASVDGIQAGNGGWVSSFSLHPLKNLNAAGDAGILTTNDAAAAEQLRLLRNHGLKNREEVVRWGFNSRLDTIQAAILRTRLPKLRQIVERRRSNAALYSEGLRGVVECPVERQGEFHTYHVYVIQTDRRDELQADLASNGIETKVHYPIPIHRQKAAEDLGYGPGSMPMAEMQAKRILSLPIHQYLKRDTIEFIIDRIRKFQVG